MSRFPRASRREFLGTAIAATQAAAAVQSEDVARRRGHAPNVLLIMADQLVPFLTGPYGHPQVKTPNVDRLARRGVRFDAAYSPNPLCAPARASMMTGKYSSAIGVHDNAAPFDSDEPTLAHRFERAGYETAWSGKMHYVGPDQHHGLRYRISHDIYPADFSWVKSRDKKTPGQHARNYISSGIHVGRADRRLDENGVPHGNLALDEEAHRNALEYLALRGKKPQEPFFLGVSYNYPHEPFWPLQEDWDLYEGAEIDIPEFPANLEETYSVMDRWLNRHHGADQQRVRDPDSLRRLHRAYYALVTLVDRWVGELLETLDRDRLAGNTIVVFTSDHGDMLGHKGMVQKRSFYEWSSRIPLLIAMPDGKWAGSTVPEPVSLIDLAPTLLELAGVPIDTVPAMDGVSLVPLVEGNRDPERCVFSESHSEGMHATCFLARKGRWKYTYIHGHPPQLFDVVADPEEWRNLAEDPAHQQVARELRAKVLNRFDPDEIEKNLRASIANREFTQPVIAKNGRSWRLKPDPIR